MYSIKSDSKTINKKNIAKFQCKISQTYSTEYVGFARHVWLYIQFSNRCTFLFWLFCLAQHFRTNIFRNTWLGKDDVHEKSSQIFIKSTGQHDVLRGNPVFLVVLTDVSSQLEQFTDHVLYHTGHADGGCHTNAIRQMTFTQLSTNASNWEH